MAIFLEEVDGVDILLEIVMRSSVSRLTVSNYNPYALIVSAGSWMQYFSEIELIYN